MAQYEIRTCALCRMDYTPSSTSSLLYCDTICRKWAPFLIVPRGIKENQFLTTCKSCGQVIVNDAYGFGKYSCFTCRTKRMREYYHKHKKKR